MFDQHAEPLPRLFLGESVNGNIVECCLQGSRPLYNNVLTEFQLTYTVTIGLGFRRWVLVSC